MKAIKITALLLIALAASSCVENIVTEENGSELFLRPVESPAVKAAMTGTTFPLDRALSLSSTRGGAAWFTGVTFRHDATLGAWHGVPSKYWPLEGTLNLFSCSTVSWGSALSWSVPATSGATLVMGDNSATQDDIVFASAASVAPAAPVPMVFSHAQTMVSFTVGADVAYDETTNTGIAITGITLSPAWWSGTVVATASGNTVSYAWSALGTRAEVAVTGIAGGVPASATAKGAPLMLPPQAAVGFSVEYVQHNGFDAEGDPVNLPLVYTYIPEELDWTAGTRNVYGIWFTLDDVLVNADIEPWQEVTLEVATSAFITGGVDVTSHTIGGEWQL